MPDIFAKLIRWWLVAVCWVTFAGFVGALLNVIGMFIYRRLHE
ncbi:MULTISPECIES: hypothetical protein [Paraburkholderia]|uniref:DUF2474 domain-containing protein n=2 Tax=Paraburkholderia TaxID=1822464 RepID=A0A1N7SWJ2_9BURK|nr:MULTISPECIES: hypothetical protein [Paraburkholderia]CAB4051840.1 hypothetical protein LMG9964_05519 [Paraburkholderia phenoliruptrix]SIT51783.1 hypothetical protein BN2476_1380044 [Paraburkholderia piptadeniae]